MKKLIIIGIILLLLMIVGCTKGITDKKQEEYCTIRNSITYRADEGGYFSCINGNTGIRTDYHIDNLKKLNNSKTELWIENQT